jgi:hypothetical protein
METNPSIVLACLWVVLLGGCGGGTQEAKCVPGLSVTCACLNRQGGAKTCTSAGTLTGCACTAPTVDAGSAVDDAAATSPADAAAISPGDAAGTECGSDSSAGTSEAGDDAPASAGGVDGGDAQSATVLQGIFAPTGSMNVARYAPTSSGLQRSMTPWLAPSPPPAACPRREICIPRPCCRSETCSSQADSMAPALSRAQIYTSSWE